MPKIQKTNIFSGIFFLLALLGHAQKPNFYGNFDFIADNREYFSQFANAQTILGGRVDFGAHFKLDSSNSFYLGANCLYEFGHKVNAHLPIPDMYYEFKNRVFNFKFGSFPRKNSINYPKVLLTDTLLYYRPNIQGALAQINFKQGFQNLWLDWTSRQTETTRETFLAGLSGKISMGIFYIENYAYMYHHAPPKKKPPGCLIRDNGGASLHFGIDLSGKTAIESLRLDLGTVGSYDRWRPDSYQFANGLMGRFFTQYKRVGMDGVLYFGDKQSLAYGDRFYSGGNYSRIDLFFEPFRSNRVNSRVTFGLHFPENDFNQSQQIMVGVSFLE